MFEVTMNLYWDLDSYDTLIFHTEFSLSEVESRCKLIFDEKFKNEYEFWRVVNVQRVD